MKKIPILLSLIAIFSVACKTTIIQENQVSNLSFTPCQQSKLKLKSNAPSDTVNVEFTNNGVKITYNNFAVTCDFSTVDVTYTFVNGFLNITQQGSPNQAKCVCYTDVSYTINGISQNDVNVIFINGKQVYCHNGTIPNDSIEKWIWTYHGINVMLDLYPNENKFYSTVSGDTIMPKYTLFGNDVWTYYKMIGDTMYVRGENENFPTENDRYGKWFIHQHTKDTLAMRYLGTLPTIPKATYYIFTRQKYPIEIPFDIIGQGNLNSGSGFTKQFSVIKTQTDWENLKTQLNSVNNVTNNFTETDIDFSLYQVIFVIDKVKSNGGWSIDVTEVTENSDNIVVTVSNLKTGNTASVITQPFEVVKIPATNKPIIFNDLTKSNLNNYPIEIPFTDYSLTGTSCQWQWANLAINKVAVIKSDDELMNYIVCTDSSPQIDFLEYTLLLARGGASSNIVSIKKQFQQTSVNEYSLNVDITLGMAAVAPGWYMSIRTPKLSQYAVVTLNVNNHY